MQVHRLVVAPRSGLRRAPNKRHRIYESEYLARIMHKFSTASPKSLALTCVARPASGCPRPPQRTLQYACRDLGRPAPCQAGAFGAS